MAKRRMLNGEDEKKPRHNGLFKPGNTYGQTPAAMIDSGV